MQGSRLLHRDDRRIIIHFDYDCFYAAVVENENPALKSVPLAIQQKQIVVTCNYEARRRGLHKLQLITEAKKVCPEAVIILGEDLTRFRDASKNLYNFLLRATWSRRAERLGFDEVWLDCTDMVDHNIGLLNQHDLQHSFFCLDQSDPISGFEYDASKLFGQQFPKLINDDTKEMMSESDLRLRQRLILGSHLARHLRHELERQRGYTATVGIATNKVLSKLVGNVNKPRNQTTLMPPYDQTASSDGAAVEFMDSHDIGKVPGIGFKLSQKMRAHVLGRQPQFDQGLVYGGTKENICVRDVRLFPEMSSDLLEVVLGGPGSPKRIGAKIWLLLHGIDDGEVGRAKRVPSQISQEDSYMKYLSTFDQVRRQLLLLTERLLRRMQLDLMEDDVDEAQSDRRWLAHARTLRLTTRPRPPLDVKGQRIRTFNRISRSAPMPTFVFGLRESITATAERLVNEALVPMFRKLHPQNNGWNLSLINIAATNMAETAADTKDSEGRDIGRMFQRQDDVLKDFQVTVVDNESDREEIVSSFSDNSEDTIGTTGQLIEEDDEMSETTASDGHRVHICSHCQAGVPLFAQDAHQRFHAMAD